MKEDVERIESFTAVIDEDLKFKIPKEIVASLKVTPGDEFLVHFDERTNEMMLTPLQLNRDDVVKVEFVLPDEIGALAKVAEVLAKHRLNLLLTTSKTIKEGELAVWEIVADISKNSDKLKDIIDELKEKKLIMDVEVSY